jgi:hypothetical protein
MQKWKNHINTKCHILSLFLRGGIIFLYQAAATNAVATAGDFDGVNFAFFDVAVNAAPNLRRLFWRRGEYAIVESDFGKEDTKQVRRE